MKNLFGELKAGNVSLKKVTTKEAPKIQHQICANSEDYKRLMEETYMEEYWEEIKDYTFASEFLPLPRDYAQDLMNAYGNYESKGEFNGLNTENLQNLAQQIDEAIIKLRNETNMKEEDGIFIRLSSRSPKDAVTEVSGLTDLFDKELEWVLEREQSSGCVTGQLNQRLHACYRASTYIMCVQSGERAIELLCKSKRIQGDFVRYLEDKSAVFNCIIREFRKFNLHLEFRGFVYNKELTGLTQYNDTCYFPMLHAEKEQIQTIIIDAFNEMKSQIPLEHYVCDFVLCGDNPEEYTFHIIEINPFAEFAGTGLFNWTKDKQKLMGNGEFEFRMVETEPKAKQILGEINPIFLSFLEDLEDENTTTEIAEN